MAINICSLSREEAEELTNQLTVLDANIGKKIDKVTKLTGMSYQDSLEYVVTDSPVLWAKVYLNWEARDYQQPILYEGKRSKQLVLRLGRRLGKCLPGDVEIPDSVTGEYITVEELFKRQNANIYSLNESDLKINRHKTNIIFENGIKPVYKLTTKSGREIKATGNHPFYTIKGFKELDDLKVGDHVAIAKNMQHESNVKIDEERIKTIVDEINTSNIKDKAFPNIIYKLSNKSLSIFLSRLHIVSGSSDKEKLKINYYNSSEKICISVQRLLLRFGINSKLNSKVNDMYYLTIDERNDVIKFCKNINNVYNINTEQSVKENTSLNDIYWDEIKSIEYVEDTMTYDLTVPEYHNFVANDFITHNTDSMCVLILWFAYTQINRGDNGQYNILILTPYETQIDLIFTRLDQLIEASPFMQECISRQIHHRKELKNGSIILGLTAGASSGNNGSNNTRGQPADLIVLDEVDYIGSSQITNILNIRNEAPERIKIMAASTPCGKHEEFYKWCVNSTKSYKPDPKDIKNMEFNGYNITSSINERGDKGNGWTEIYAPSVVNKELLKINEITEQTYLQDIKDELSELRYAQEVMAEFGEEELGVYQKKYLKAAMQEGLRTKHHYFNNMTPMEIKEYRLHHRENIFLLGIDWDHVQAGTTIVGVMFDKEFINDMGENEPKFRVILREEIPKSKFTLTNAVDRVIQLNDMYDFDWIAIDRGYGDVQLEMFHKYGMANPETGLAEKVIGYQFGEKIEVRDPYTFKKDKKPLKPFMVNNSVVAFERGTVVFDPSDKQLIEQFEAYKVERISTTGLPVYTSENEHIVDAFNLCLLIFQQKYGSLFKLITTSRISTLSMPDRTKFEPVSNRDITVVENKNKGTTAVIMSNREKTTFSSRGFTSGSKLFGGSSMGGGRGFGFRRRAF